MRWIWNTLFRQIGKIMLTFGNGHYRISFGEDNVIFCQDNCVSQSISLHFPRPKPHWFVVVSVVLGQNTIESVTLRIRGNGSMVERLCPTDPAWPWLWLWIPVANFIGHPQFNISPIRTSIDLCSQLDSISIFPLPQGISRAHPQFWQFHPCKGPNSICCSGHFREISTK